MFMFVCGFCSMLFMKCVSVVSPSLPPSLFPPQVSSRILHNPIGSSTQNTHKKNHLSAMTTWEHKSYCFVASLNIANTTSPTVCVFPSLFPTDCRLEVCCVFVWKAIGNNIVALVWCCLQISGNSAEEQQNHST